jgi:CRP-like cAMP-binding protein
MREDGDTIWGLVGLALGLVLAGLVLLPVVTPSAGPVLTWGLLVLVGLIGGGLALASFVTSRANSESKSGSGLQATAAAATAAFPVERAGLGRDGGTVTEQGPAMTDLAEVARLCARLRETDVFEALTDDELRLVVGIGEVRPVVAGTRLAQEGDRGDDLYVILRGQLQLLAPSDTGELRVRVAQAGETIPLAAILEPPVLVTTVEAVTDGEVLTIPRLELLDLCERDPKLGLNLYRAAAKVFEQRYRNTLDRLTDSLRRVLEFAAAGTEIAH